MPNVGLGNNMTNTATNNISSVLTGTCKQECPHVHSSARYAQAVQKKKLRHDKHFSAT